MKKYFKVILLLLVVVMCTACNGKITREIRHAGFDLGNKFACDGFFPEEKEDTSFNRIRYFTGAHLIDVDGKIYELSLDKTYQDKQNCREADTTIIVKAIMDDRIVKGMDDKYYYLVGQNDVSSYSEIPTTDNAYEIYNLLLKDVDIIKVITANSSTGEYYVLKTDGNVYSYTITKKDYNAPPTVTAVSTIYNKNDYDSKIVDFNYAGESINTFIKTENKVYRMFMTNASECTKYADIECTYQMKQDPLFDEYGERILMYNGNQLLTDFNQLFTVSTQVRG